jgi:glycosyltransferase involved in cell wall biosynthesis
VDASSMGVLPANVEVRAMDAQELRRAYADAAIVVVPLVAADNNAGISVLLEAMSMGRPVIVTRTAGQHDVVVDGVTGLYVPPGDPAALRDAIRRLFDDPAAAEAMGRRARADVLAHHRADDFAARIREVAGMPAERVEEVRRA